MGQEDCVAYQVRIIPDQMMPGWLVNPASLHTVHGTSYLELLLAAAMASFTCTTAGTHCKSTLPVELGLAAPQEA